MKIIFGGATVPLATLLLIMVAKLALTPWSLGAGFAGGVIGPSLLVGSALGAAYGQLMNMLIPGLGISPTAFAMVATAAMLAGTFHAPLFAAMLMFQMSQQYVMLLPLLIAAAIGYAVANRFQSGSAYTYMFPDLGIQLKPGLYTMSHPNHPVQRAETTP
jgi:chloride channel protein, CIC family